MFGIPYRYLTEDLPGIGGRIKVAFDDFIVEEVPLYTPCGEGEHVYFELEKTDVSTYEALRRLGKALGREFRDFGFAGMKDRRGITRQVFSVAGHTPTTLMGLELRGMKVRWARLHHNKLRLGHLRGNRFRIRVRHVEKPDAGLIEEILSVVRAFGMPNYFGPQRFGSRGDAQWVGRSFLLHDDAAGVRRLLGCPASSEGNPDIVRARYLFMQYRWRESLWSLPPSYREERKILAYLLRAGENWRGARRRLRNEILRLYFTAYQSHLFNRCLERRLEACTGDPGRFLSGDLAFLHRNGALFFVDDPLEVDERKSCFEISPSGPMYGKTMLAPIRGAEAEIEEAILEADGVRRSDFNQLQQRVRLSGGRRPFRVEVEDLEWELEQSELRLRFFLPRGSYATTFLRELMKNEEPLPGFLEVPES